MSVDVCASAFWVYTRTIVGTYVDFGNSSRHCCNLVVRHQLNCGLFRVDAVVSENREQQRVLLWRLLRPRSREGEFARGFEASSALTCRGHLAQEAFCGFGHLTSTCFGVCFGHILAKVSPREVRGFFRAHGLLSSACGFCRSRKNEEGWRTRDEVRYSKLPPGGVIEGVTVS